MLSLTQGGHYMASACRNPQLLPKFFLPEPRGSIVLPPDSSHQGKMARQSLLLSNSSHIQSLEFLLSPSLLLNGERWRMCKSESCCTRTAVYPINTADWTSPYQVISEYMSTVPPCYWMYGIEYILLSFKMKYVALWTFNCSHLNPILFPTIQSTQLGHLKEGCKVSRACSTNSLEEINFLWPRIAKRMHWGFSCSCSILNGWDED